MTLHIDNITDHLTKIAPAGGLLVAYSGGIDSVLLLTAAMGTKLPVLAVTFTHCLQPSADLTDANSYAAKLGVEHIVIHADPLSIPEVSHNHTDRCYHCKRGLFTSLAEIARQRGMMLVDGTNADDLKVYRPGRRALDELGVRSPLAELGLSKPQVRETAREAGITALASKPSGSCYATRLPYNTVLTPELLDMVRKAEEMLSAMGYTQNRVRLHHDVNAQPIARIEVELPQLPRVLEQKDEITAQLKALGFAYITVDLEGWRSGSMDYFPI